RQTESLIGFFVNMQANRTILNGSQSFEDLIQEVHNDQINAQMHQDLPFEKLIDELGVDRDTSRHSIFQVMFGVQSFGSSNDGFEYNDATPFRPYDFEDVYEVAKYDLSIFIDDSQEELLGEISYATSLFTKESIARLSNHYVYLLNELTQNSSKFHNEISLLNSEDYQQIIHDWNATDKAYSKDKTIQELFEDQVEKTPNNIALVYEGESLTYGQLNEKSNQLAHHIRARYKAKTQKELTADTLIALCLERSLEMVIGILGVLKAGGAYVPIDPSLPQERIDYVLEDTQAQIILSQRHLENSPKLPQEKVVYIDLSEELYRTQAKTNLPQQSQSNDLAYVIYTSGTTGKPKGAMLNHSGIVNRIEWMQNRYPLNSEDVVLQKTPYVFDVSVWELLWANWYGAKIVMAKSEGHKDSEYLHQLIQKEKVTTLHFVPSMLEAYNHYLLEQENIFSPSIKQIFCSGEALNNNTVQQTYKNVIGESLKLHNLYGPTEASIDVTFYETTPTKNVYIGKPIQNTQVYILSPNQTPVPIGVIGELYLGGIGLSRGYLNRPELTAERFVDNPFATQEDKTKGYTKLYKTGDLVRWLADGTIEYLGRNDDQVKIRGYRIELGEIEHAISQIAGIKQVSVQARDRVTENGSSKYLVGYYVLNVEETGLAVDAIESFLSGILPDYMIPSAFVEMESFPLTINGKLNKRLFADPDFSSSDSDYVAPVTEEEIEVCKIWSDLLGLDRVGITDDFFKIGGNSILALQATHRMSKILGCNVKVADIFKHKTINNLKDILVNSFSFESIEGEDWEISL
ncbi:amino acid adenylation domain-containing protein, partial [Flavobacterium sp. LS1R47]